MTMADSPFDLSGKIALVTGTSRGLGQCFGRALARAGADLIITSRDPATLKGFQAEVESLGRKVLCLALDVRRHESIQAMAEAFNALNHRNDLIPNGTFGTGAFPLNPSASFGRPTAVGDARSVQLAMRIIF